MNLPNFLRNKLYRDNLLKPWHNQYLLAISINCIAVNKLCINDFIFFFTNL